MSRLLLILLCLTAVAIVACRSSGIHSAQVQTHTDSLYTSTLDTASRSNFRQIAVKHLGEGVECAVNEAQTMVLCKKTETAGRAPMVNKVRFIVVVLANDAIIHQDQIANGNVEWNANTQLKISTLPETVQVTSEARQPYYIFDVETKQKLLPGVQKF